jgi:hypothetical protein
MSRLLLDPRIRAHRCHSEPATLRAGSDLSHQPSCLARRSAGHFAGFHNLDIRVTLTGKNVSDGASNSAATDDRDLRIPELSNFSPARLGRSAGKFFFRGASGRIGRSVRSRCANCPDPSEARTVGADDPESRDDLARLALQEQSRK